MLFHFLNFVMFDCLLFKLFFALLLVIIIAHIKQHQMNQGVYFGQIIIGPAGAGKVTLYFISVNILSSDARDGIDLKTQHCNFQS